MPELVAQVLLPLPLQPLYSYRIPQRPNREPAVGKRVLAPFGKNKIYTGVIHAFETWNDGGKLGQLKYLDEILDDEPVVTPALLQLFQWVADYYLCSAGEVLKAALPANLKLESELVVQPAPDLDLSNPEITDREYLVLEALSMHRELTLKEIGEILDVKHPREFVKKLENKRLVVLAGKTQDLYKPKTIRLIQLTEAYRSAEAIDELFVLLKKSPKQSDVLLKVAEAFFKDLLIEEKEILSRLEISPSAIRALKERGIIEYVEAGVDRLSDLAYRRVVKKILLTEEQQAALALLRHAAALPKPKPMLLHGVTGSGKTHIYIELIRDALARGQQSLYLLPEIALTKQIIDKVKTEFGDAVGVYHSRFNDNERVEIWQKTLRGDYQVVIGARSALWLPFPNLGLIVVDEEHDPSFKQQDPAPRFNARDAALYYAGMLNIPIVLGSATPAMETYRNALEGRFLMVEIKNRAQKSRLPEIELVDMRIQFKEKTSHGQFSNILLTAIKETVERGEQVILFNRRRGYSPYLICNQCGHIPKCLNCDISLTYHKQHAYLRCHYCGYTDYLTDQCSACNSLEMRREGLGTERIEEQLQELFPNLRIERMDSDTTRGKNALRNLLNRFEHKEIDVLVGTQMVTKGLDFENVTLVGVLQTDGMLAMPDFRAFETAYQILTQFSGRAGRSDKKGRVLIQTSNPEHPVFTLLSRPYREFYDMEIEARRWGQYPPFTRILRLELLHANKTFAEAQAKIIGDALHQKLGKMMLGPEYPPIIRLRNYFRLHILVKIPRNFALSKLKASVMESLQTYYRNAPDKTLRIIKDVDPR